MHKAADRNQTPVYNCEFNLRLRPILVHMQQKLT